MELWNKEKILGEFSVSEFWAWPPLRRDRFIRRCGKNFCIDLIRKRRESFTSLDKVKCPPSFESELINTQLINAFDATLPKNLARVLKAMYLCNCDKIRAAKLLGLSKKSVKNSCSKIKARAVKYAQNQTRQFKVAAGK